MASKSNRQRRLERQRTERRMAKRAEHARRKRRIQAGIGGALALILVALGTTWLLGGFDSKPAQDVTLPSCSWTAKDVSSSPGITDTGLPPSSGEPRTGVQVITIKLQDDSEISAVIDTAKVPCAAASMKFLGGKGYYDGTTCHHLDTTTLALTCGDPKGDGTGSPGYQFPVEGVPTEPIGTAAPVAPGASPSSSASAGSTPSYYAKGTIVLANSDVNANGGQFYIVYGDGSNLSNQFTPVGTVVKGIDLVEAIAAGGVEPVNGSAPAAGTPVKKMTIKTLSVDDQLAQASPEVSPSVSPSS